MPKLFMYYDIEWHSIKTCIELKYIEQHYNSIDFKFNFVFKFNSSQVCMAYNGLHHFSMSPLFWENQNNQLQKKIFFFSTKSTKLVEPQILKVTNLEILNL